MFDDGTDQGIRITFACMWKETNQAEKQRDEMRRSQATRGRGKRGGSRFVGMAWVISSQWTTSDIAPSGRPVARTDGRAKAADHRRRVECVAPPVPDDSCRGECRMKISSGMKEFTMEALLTARNSSVATRSLGEVAMDRGDSICGIAFEV